MDATAIALISQGVKGTAGREAGNPRHAFQPIHRKPDGATGRPMTTSHGSA